MDKEKSKKIKILFWDWNGTLLNDMDLCINSMNQLLAKRQLPLLDIRKYREIFTFPVREYYREAGFDFEHESFDIPATEFINIYNSNFNKVGIFPGAKQTLRYLKDKGFRQYIISAMKKPQLIESVKHQQLHPFFEEIRGIDNHYADGKAYLATTLMEKEKFNPDEVCIIGDTLHDHEIAEAIGCDCILLNCGHQSQQRLRSSGRKVIDNISGITEIF